MRLTRGSPVEPEPVVVHSEELLLAGLAQIAKAEGHGEEGSEEYIPEETAQNKPEIVLGLVLVVAVVVFVVAVAI